MNYLCEGLQNYITKQNFRCPFWNYEENIYGKHHKCMFICNCFTNKLSVKHHIRNILIQMSVGMKVSFLLVETGVLILGLLGNGFIGLVNCIEWVKTGQVSSADFILTSLAVARIIHLGLILLDSYILGFSPYLYATVKLPKVVSILWTLTNHLSTWFATCLSVFYFLKIANFSHSFYNWLKWRVDRVVLMIFMGSFSLLSVNLIMHDVVGQLWMNIYIVPEGNMTLHLDGSKISCLKGLLLVSLTYVIPFFLSLISLLLLYLSLVRHTKNLQLNLTDSRDSSTVAHRRAIKMVTTFILLFIIYFISILTGSWISTKVQTSQAIILVMVITTIFPSGHSFIIILGNSKLRKIALRLLWHLKSLGLSKHLTV